ncbi:MAG: chlorite dismutase family protein [Planctomycetia bacterium]
MSRPHTSDPAAGIATAIEPSTGWHVSHLFYRFDHERLGRMTAAERAAGIGAFTAALDPAGPTAPRRLQAWIVPGHKADFAVMAMDPSPLAVDAVHQRLLAGPLGAALEPSYSFVSLTEVSEYVPSVEQYAERLVAEGEERDSPPTKPRCRATPPASPPCGRPASSPSCRRGPTRASTR